MWHPLTITDAPASEPLSLDEAKRMMSVDYGDDDALIGRLIATARAHVEAYTGLKLVTQTISAKCDCFDDLKRFPFGPVQSISSITYVDGDGAEQTLATSVYEGRFDGLDAGVVLKFGQSWPAIQRGSRISVTAILGFAAVPEPIVHVIALLASHWYERREAANEKAQTAIPFGVDDLLANYRLGV